MIWDGPVFWFSIAFGVLVGFYVFLPLKVWLRRRMPARPRLERFELGEIDRGAAEYLARHAADLLASGFDEPTHFRVTEVGVPLTSYIVLAVDRAGGTVGSVSISLLGPLGLRRLARTSFADRTDADELVVTTNMAEPLLWVRPGAVVAQVPGFGGVADLLALHRAAVGRNPPEGEPAVYEPGGEAEYLHAVVFRQHYAEGERQGYLWHDAAAGEYRFTLAGAYLATWLSLFPLKQFRAARVGREERRLLAEYGFDRPAGAANGN